jgi:hypothetical protein
VQLRAREEFGRWKGGGGRLGTLKVLHTAQNSAPATGTVTTGCSWLLSTAFRIQIQPQASFILFNT